MKRKERKRKHGHLSGSHHSNHSNDELNQVNRVLEVRVPVRKENWFVRFSSREKRKEKRERRESGRKRLDQT